jgi:hypothetical protein
MIAQSGKPARLTSLASGTLFVVLPLAALADTPVAPTPLPTAQEIVERMQAADAVRSGKLAGYTATRVYQLDNRRFHKQARITARVTYRRPGEKSFEVIAEEGSHLLDDRVLSA